MTTPAAFVDIDVATTRHAAEELLGAVYVGNDLKVLTDAPGVAMLLGRSTVGRPVLAWVVTAC